MVVYFCNHLTDNYVDLLDLYVDLSEIMSTCQIIFFIFMALTWQEHDFKIYFLTNELITSQHKDLTSLSQHKV